MKENNNLVFVLLQDSATRGESEQNVQVFHALASAKSQLQKEYNAELNDWKKWCDEDYLVTEESTIGDWTKTIYELGNYNENHVSWTIQLKEIK